MKNQRIPATRAKQIITSREEKMDIPQIAYAGTSASLNFRVMARYYEYERAKKPDWRGFWSTGSERESVYTNWPKTDPD
jgi:hypothetical protein